jgi:hypothetical protein
LRSFALDKIYYWRERASGMSSLAYFLAKDTIDHFNTIVKPIVYLSMFYFFNNPRSSIWENYVVLVALTYCVTGIGYTFAIFFQPGSAQLVFINVYVSQFHYCDHQIKRSSWHNLIDRLSFLVTHAFFAVVCTPPSRSDPDSNSAEEHYHC